jgi:hypothetical protein
VGHPMRQEYTVIGAKVNLAARLMANYHGLVSCDEETMAASHLIREHFKLLPPRELHGVAEPGRIFEYNPTFQYVLKHLLSAVYASMLSAILAIMLSVAFVILKRNIHWFDTCNKVQSNPALHTLRYTYFLFTYYFFFSMKYSQCVPKFCYKYFT